MRKDSAKKSGNGRFPSAWIPSKGEVHRLRLNLVALLLPTNLNTAQVDE
jgi:hypothetical protein